MSTGLWKKKESEGVRSRRQHVGAAEYQQRQGLKNLMRAGVAHSSVICVIVHGPLWPRIPSSMLQTVPRGNARPAPRSRQPAAGAAEIRKRPFQHDAQSWWRRRHCRLRRHPQPENELPFCRHCVEPDTRERSDGKARGRDGGALSERNRPPGSVPHQITPGSSGPPASNAHMRAVLHASGRPHMSFCS
jgi:hypothetical protein